MAGRPRTPAKILELRGAFKNHPNRRRKDAEGSAPFDPKPPAHLPADAVPAWEWIVSRLPKVAIYNTDEIPTEIAARLLSRYWLTGEMPVLKEVRAWLGKAGILPAGPREAAGNAGAAAPQSVR